MAGSTPDVFRIYARTFPYPSKFQMTKVPNIVCELTTMSGQTVADVNGWKYADTSIQWSALENDILQELITVAGLVSFELTFLQPNGQETTVNAISRGLSYSKARYKNDGSFVWEDVTLDLSFPDCYGRS